MPKTFAIKSSQYPVLLQQWRRQRAQLERNTLQPNDLRIFIATQAASKVGQFDPMARYLGAKWHTLARWGEV
jgi:hypothetical protein